MFIQLSSIHSFRDRARNLKYACRCSVPASRTDLKRVKIRRRPYWLHPPVYTYFIHPLPDKQIGRGRGGEADKFCFSAN